MQKNLLLCQGAHPFVSCGTKIVITWVFCYFFKKQPFLNLSLIIYKLTEIILKPVSLRHKYKKEILSIDWEDHKKKKKLQAK